MLRSIATTYRTLRTRALIAWFNRRGIRLPRTTQLDVGVDLVAGVNHQSQHGLISAGSRCHLSRGVVIHAYGGTVRLAENVFLGPYTVVYGHGGVTIADDTLVSMHCRILSSNHAIPPRNVTVRSQPDVLLPTRIGRDVWLGAGVTVLGGVTIGDGCIVGAGAVVSRDLPAYSIAIGVPAKVVRSRT